jgi:hypothetical protein
MTMRTWIRNFFPRATPRSIRKTRVRVPLRLELLECRLSPSATPTATVVTPASTTINFGQIPTVTATVSSDNGVPPDGNVLFLVNGVPYPYGNPVPVASDGTAQIQINEVVGSYQITAEYLGDANFAATAPAAETAASLTVNATTATTPTSTAVYGQDATVLVGEQTYFTATVNGGVGGTGEQLLFLVNGVPYATVTEPMFALPTLPFSSYTAGVYTVTVEYQGDDTYIATLPSAETAATVVVTPTPTQTTVTASTTTASYGQSVTCTAYVNSLGSPTDGSMQFFVNGTAYGSPVPVTSVDFTGTAQLAITEPANASGYTVTAEYLGDANYFATTPDAETGATFTVSPATLTVTANAQTKVYGSTDPALSYAASGFQLGDTAATVLSGALSRNPGESVAGGPYAINQGTLAADANYTISFTGNNLTISPAPLTVSASPESKVYGSADPTLYYAAGGFQFGDTAATVLSGALSRAAGETVADGPYTITQGTLAANSDYTISFTGSSLTITPAPLFVSANPQTKIGGSSDPELTYTVNGLQLGDTADTVLSGALGRDPGEDAGTYAINQGTLTANSNYTIDFSGSNLTINLTPSFISARSTTFTVGVNGSFTVSTFSSPVPTLTETGDLPDGVTFVDNGDGTGTLSGTPGPDTGEYVFTLTADNGTGTVATQTFDLTVIDPPTFSNTSSTATFTVGTPSSFAIATIPGLPLTTTVTEQGTLPQGLKFVPGTNGTASITGTPKTGSGGVYTITLVATDGGFQATQTETLIVDGPEAFVGSTTPTFTVGEEGTFPVDTTGYPYGTLVLGTGTLPAGLQFTDNGNGTGEITGVPAVGTDGTFQIQIVDELPQGAAMNPQGGGLLDTIKGAIKPANIRFTDPLPQNPISVIVGTKFLSQTLKLNRALGTSDKITLSAGSPAWVNIAKPAKGDTSLLLSGTAPKGSGSKNGVTYSFSVSVKQTSHDNEFAPAVAQIVLQVFEFSSASPKNINVNSPGASATPQGGNLAVARPARPTATLSPADDVAPSFTSAQTTAFAVGVNTQFTVTTLGSPVPTLTETGDLPDGVTFVDNGDGTGTLSGSPEPDTGEYVFTLTADNGTGTVATQTFNLQVIDPPTFSNTPSTATFNVGQSSTFAIATIPGLPLTTTVTEQGTPPAGLQFKQGPGGTATISGTPNPGSGGVYTITLVASNGVFQTTQTETLYVTGGPAFTGGTTPTFTVGEQGTFMVDTTSLPYGALVQGTGSLPAGLQFIDNGNGTGEITGVPAVGTDGTFQIQIIEETITGTGFSPQVGGGISETIFGKVKAAPAKFNKVNFAAYSTIDGFLSPNGATLTIYTNTDYGNGYYPNIIISTTLSGNPIQLSVTGFVPAGMKFIAASISKDNGSFGYLDGATRLAGTYKLTFTATDFNTKKVVATQVLTLVVTQRPGAARLDSIDKNAPGATTTAPKASALTKSTLQGKPSLIFLSSYDAKFSTGAVSSFPIRTTGSAATTLTVTGTLPRGLVFIDNGNGTATIAGKAAAGSDGTYGLVITASDGGLTEAVQKLTLDVYRLN